MNSKVRIGLMALVMGAAGVAGSALAQTPTLPGWKIADICAKESAPGQCANFEGEALRAISATWTFVLDPIKDACLKQARTPSDQSWRLLAECLDNATLAADAKSAVLTARTPAEPVPPPRPAAPPTEVSAPAADPAAPPPAAPSPAAPEGPKPQ